MNSSIPTPHTLLTLVACAISYILVILARQRHCVDLGICVDIMKYRWSSARAVLLDEEGEIEVREELVV